VSLGQTAESQLSQK